MDSHGYATNRTASGGSAAPTKNIRALTPGTLLNGQYRIESVLGEGGFGITYAGYDLYLKLKVAIKEYFPGMCATRNTTTGNSNISINGGEGKNQYLRGLKDFEFEANRLTKFSNLPGIVSVYNFFFENNTAYMVMEFVDGITLQTYLTSRGGRISWQETLLMMKDVIESFENVHSAGIIHRDISPDNIIISKDNKATIIDFGAARNWDDEKSRTIILKHGYAPPEQYFSSGKQGPWTDVYAMCSTMYRMITGVKMPDAMAVWDKSAVKVPVEKYAPGIPANVANTLMKGTEPAIENRISSMKELEEYLYKSIRVSSLQKKKNPVVLWIVIAVLAICGLASVGLIVKNLQTGKEVPAVSTNGNDNEDAEAVVQSDSDLQDGEESGQATDANTSGKGNSGNADDAGNADSNADSDKEKVEVVDVIPEAFDNVEIPSEKKITYSAVEGGVQIDAIVNTEVNISIPNTINGMKVISIGSTNSNVVNVLINEGIKSIKNDAFRNCVYLEYLYIPSTVSEIGKNAFVNCLSIKQIYVSQNNPYYYVDGNTLYDSNGKVIVSW